MLRQITATTDEPGLAKKSASSSPQSLTRKATKDEINVFKSDQSARLTTGVPPWENPDGSTRNEHQASRRTLREWADNYATSPKLLKEFVYQKVRFLRSCLSPFASNFTRLTNFLHKSRSSTAGTPPNSDKPSRAPSHQRLTRETSASSSPSPPEPRSASAPITASPAPFPRLSTKYSSSYSSSTPSSGYSSASPPEAEAGGKFMEARMR